MSLALRSAYPDLYNLSIAAENYLVDAYAQYPVVYPSYFDIIDSTKKSETVSQLGGVGQPPIVGEGSDSPEATPVEGYDVTFTHDSYKQTIKISQEAYEDDPKGQLANLQNLVNMHYKACVTKIEVLCATQMMNGFATACLDGQYLFDTDHPTSPSNSATLSNLITSKLDAAGNAIADMQIKIDNNGIDMAGNQIGYGRLIVMVPPDLYNNALKSCVAKYGTAFGIASYGVYSGIVGGSQAATPAQTGELFRTSSNTGSELLVVKNPYIGTHYSGGSAVKWYVFCDPAENKGTHSNRLYMRVRPQLDGAYIHEPNKSYCFPFRMRVSVGNIDWRHVWASNGTV